MILIDGMPIVSGLATVYGLTGIPQSLIDRIEVVKGPQTVLYGRSAFAGAINYISKRPGDELEGSVSAMAASSSTSQSRVPVM